MTRRRRRPQLPEGIAGQTAKRERTGERGARGSLGTTRAIHQPDMAAAKITATGNIDRMPCACMVALAMSTKKPTAEMAEPIWGRGQPPLRSR